jgi:anti-sigma regulatory factor (Ser/Thr protein kinase)
VISENAILVGDFVQRLSATRRGARLARLLTVQQLAAWGVPYGSESSDVAAAVVSELAANAALHGRVPGRDFELRLALRTDRTLCIEVSDTRPERPQAPPAGCPALDAESGRGLFLVQALALRWGVRDREVGKTVWADVSTAPDVDLMERGGAPTCHHPADEGAQKRRR